MAQGQGRPRLVNSRPRDILTGTGWLEGPNVKVPAVNLLARKGNPGFNNTAAERTFTSRDEQEWPLARTEYTKFHLRPDTMTLGTEPQNEASTLETEGLTGQSFKFETAPFEEETEITGHILANLCMGVDTAPDLDVMVTLRHIDPKGDEVFYTGELNCHV